MREKDRNPALRDTWLEAKHHMDMRKVKRKWEMVSIRGDVKQVFPCGSVKGRLYYSIPWMIVDHIFSVLRDDPRYQEIVKRQDIDIKGLMLDCFATPL